MPDEKKGDDVEKLLSEERSLEDRKKALIDDLLKQRDAAMAAFDEKLEKLGFRGNSGRHKRSHHKKPVPAAPDAAAKTAAKPKS